MAIQHWIMKSEPGTYSIDDLKSDKKTIWDGIRNYQARNFMMNDMKKGDLVFFYHSNCDVPGIYGLAEIVKPSVVDPTAFDKKSKYFDEKSTPEKPRWYCSELKYKKKFKSGLSLETMKETPSLKDLLILRRGNRLSITPVELKDAKKLISMLV